MFESDPGIKERIFLIKEKLSHTGEAIFDFFYAINNWGEEKFGKVRWNRMRGDGLGVVTGLGVASILYDGVDFPKGIITAVSFLEGLRSSSHAKNLRATLDK